MVGRKQIQTRATRCLLLQNYPTYPTVESIHRRTTQHCHQSQNVHRQTRNKILLRNSRRHLGRDYGKPLGQRGEYCSVPRLGQPRPRDRRTANGLLQKKSPLNRLTLNFLLLSAILLTTIIN